MKCWGFKECGWSRHFAVSVYLYYLSKSPYIHNILYGFMYPRHNILWYFPEVGIICIFSTLVLYYNHSKGNDIKHSPQAVWFFVNCI